LIEAKTKGLTDASSKMAERLYAQGQADQAGAQQAGAQGGDAGGDKKQENVVDAEFEEVKDDKRDAS
jgi:molecular chaperone DnaK